jgi:hypothetical protein
MPDSPLFLIVVLAFFFIFPVIFRRYIIHVWITTVSLFMMISGVIHITKHYFASNVFKSIQDPTLFGMMPGIELDVGKLSNIFSEQYSLYLFFPLEGWMRLSLGILVIGSLILSFDRITKYQRIPATAQQPST